MLLHDTEDKTDRSLPPECAVARSERLSTYWVRVSSVVQRICNTALLYLEEPRGGNHLNAHKMAAVREIFARRLAVSLWRQPLRVSTMGTRLHPSLLTMTRNSSSYSEL